MDGSTQLVAGVGKSRLWNASEAGREAARAALEPLAGRKPSAVIVFATSPYDQPALLEAIRGQVGEVPLAGCSGSGIITQAGSEEDSHRVGVMVLGGEGVQASAYCVPECSADPAAGGRALGAQIRAAARGDERVVLLFMDGLSPNATALVDGVHETYGLSCPVVGGAAADALLLERTFQYCNERVCSGGAVALVLRGRLRADVGVSHGCDAIGLPQTITRASGAWVQEIDGEPAWSFFRDYLGEDAGGLDAVRIAYLCLAERLPESDLGPFGEYLIRIPMELDTKSGALLFPGELKTGTRVHVALRNPENICQRAVETARRIVGGRPPALMLQFDCVGRGQLLFSDRTTENLIAPMQKLIGTRVPWLGAHTYGEIAPVGTRTYYHNFTVALCALYDA